MDYCRSAAVSRAPQESILQVLSTGADHGPARRDGRAHPGPMRLLPGYDHASPHPGRTRPPRGQDDESRPARRSGARLPRPSLLLWRYRHFVVALCLGGAVLMALGVLRPSPEPGQEVMVVSRQVAAGQVLTEDDVSSRTMPAQAVPASGVAGAEVIGLRTAIALEPGTVLTTSMTSAALTRGLSPEERVVQVPVEVGAELAQPGARVDIVGPAQSFAPEGAHSAEGEEPQEAVSVFDQPRNRVISSGARVLMVQSVSEGDQWTSGSKVTLVTLAVTVSDATLVVGAATNGVLGIVLSP